MQPNSSWVSHLGYLGSLGGKVPSFALIPLSLAPLTNDYISTNPHTTALWVCTTPSHPSCIQHCDPTVQCAEGMRWSPSHPFYNTVLWVWGQSHPTPPILSHGFMGQWHQSQLLISYTTTHTIISNSQLNIPSTTQHCGVSPSSHLDYNLPFGVRSTRQCCHFCVV